MDRNTPCKSIRLAVEIGTSCTSIMLLVERNTPCMYILLVLVKWIPITQCRFKLQVVKVINPRQLLIVLFLVYDIEKPMPECRIAREKLAFLPEVGCLSPASAFRHKGFRPVPLVTD